ncbi:hypothetical protein N7495_002038 [Penicillium taxi]|uniref:uncharacterized protein n=1 Tax=Penicillium taxi TaxID=168475 RepID=UPI00254549EA|nr:uncharacterized protein N7495_002038 [Penicillium taxi]KAJ5901510.1 hypothetical protein N7495_002038 [Penicillium taxi]
MNIDYIGADLPSLVSWIRRLRGRQEPMPILIQHSHESAYYREILNGATPITPITPDHSASWRSEGGGGSGTAGGHRAAEAAERPTDNHPGGTQLAPGAAATFFPGESIQMSQSSGV